MSKWMFLAPVVALTAGSIYWLFFPASPPVPQFDLDEWWGLRDLAGKMRDTSIRPFKIQFDDEMIKDLRDRLKNHRKWTPALEDVGFEYGFNSGQLDTWVDYWAQKYDFKAREAALNKYPQFKTNIQGLDIHFIRVKPENPKNKEVVPLLLLHGWPGSVREFYEAIPLLAADSDDRDFVLELIVPSLSGFGFSSMSKWMFLVPVVALTAVSIYWLFFSPPPPVPQFDLDEWWGPRDLASKKQDTSIRPFKIQFEDDMIKDLRDRLKNHRKWTPPLEGIAFEYGFNSGQLDTWVDYWAQKYDFKAREAALNKYPQFKTNIQGLDIHFIRVQSENPKKKEVVPLLLLHGWPGSVREFYEAIPLLAADSDNRDFVLELIIPSLPGYGFSSAAARPGLGAPQVGVVFRNLMHRLGYKKYYVQGGDWGSLITSNMATLFQNEVLGYHANIVFLMDPQTNILTFLASFWPSLIVEDKYQDRMYPLSSKWSHMVEEMGYMHIQATKPDTVGVALNDSPAALLAYILEKFSTWTNKDYRSLPDGGLSKKFTKDQLIDNLMFYWTTNSITTSARLYSESFNSRTFNYKLDSITTDVPTWIVQAKNELGYFPPSLIKRKYRNLVNATHLDDGGHFLALEMPKEFTSDVWNAMKAFRKLSKKGKTEL